MPVLSLVSKDILRGFVDDAVLEEIESIGIVDNVQRPEEELLCAVQQVVVPLFRKEALVECKKYDYPDRVEYSHGYPKRRTELWYRTTITVQKERRSCPYIEVFMPYKYNGVERDIHVQIHLKTGGDILKGIVHDIEWVVNYQRRYGLVKELILGKTPVNKRDVAELPLGSIMLAFDRRRKGVYPQAFILGEVYFPYPDHGPYKCVGLEGYKKYADHPFHKGVGYSDGNTWFDLPHIKENLDLYLVKAGEGNPWVVSNYARNPSLVKRDADAILRAREDVRRINDWFIDQADPRTIIAVLRIMSKFQSQDN
ncbi:MAG: hypothetical protein ACFN4K_00560 [Pauljensenia sp.]